MMNKGGVVSKVVDESNVVVLFYKSSFKCATIIDPSPRRLAWARATEEVVLDPNSQLAVMYNGSQVECIAFLRKIKELAAQVCELMEKSM